MHFAQTPIPGVDDEASADQLFEAKDIEAWTSWRETLKHNRNWRSSRIDTIIDIFNIRRDTDPEYAVLIFDKSVYFLNDIDVAFQQMYKPVWCLCYDGGQAPERRALFLREFERKNGVLLISRATGGVGLNIPIAKTDIICSAWWKYEWEAQAIKRAHRPGQTKEVLALRLYAGNCEMELYKIKIRDRKSKHNSKITDAITRDDGEVPRTWNDFDLD